ncbi:16S rRNA (guanine(527)-N(7))-methyltransferase RsmG [Limnohabitans sp. B9-3]|uniref:16S rRNA (guanine(527)-N(7))-methyltransferase RsmG n=1 Tax=Limnohabitans sp. B9-3 TaxID=1100707 RepID=UPI000C1DD56A|nr:16S rRNA (guanine(527)-N(7))-methyltransferase RsmG [Limnohabitans sp. B9-3]PIT72986.1 16S rRNA (guanine(527)-N(7))-methyltransferase RsmG [Limnohabitans sp. B9-3]
MHPLRDKLRVGLQDLGLLVDDERQAQLLAYMDLIAKWTKVYNLTAVRDADEMLTHHLLDSLAVIAPLRRELAKLDLAEQPSTSSTFRLLDVGAGAGLPGVVIAITCPDVQVTCVDTVAKKAAFVQQVAATLRLPNLKGLHARVESLTQPFDVVCSRAFASLVDFTTWSKSALAPHGVWMAMKGKHPEQEMAALPEGIEVFHVEQLLVPGLDADRCIVWLRG